MLFAGGSDIPPSPPETPPDSPCDQNNESSLDLGFDLDMGDCDRSNPNADRTCLQRGAIVVPGLQHNPPKHPNKLLPKFDPDDKGLAKNHIDKFILDVQTMNV